MKPERIPDEFPAPSYRGTQRDALERIRDAFAAGNDVVLVRAPTGSDPPDGGSRPGETAGARRPHGVALGARAFRKAHLGRPAR